VRRNPKKNQNKSEKSVSRLKDPIENFHSLQIKARLVRLRSPEHKNFRFAFSNTTGNLRSAWSHKPKNVCWRVNVRINGQVSGINGKHYAGFLQFPLEIISTLLSVTVQF